MFTFVIRPYVGKFPGKKIFVVSSQLCHQRLKKVITVQFYLSIHSCWIPWNCFSLVAYRWTMALSHILGGKAARWASVMSLMSPRFTTKERNKWQWCQNQHKLFWLPIAPSGSMFNSNFAGLFCSQDAIWDKSVFTYALGISYNYFPKYNHMKETCCFKHLICYANYQLKDIQF